MRKMFSLYSQLTMTRVQLNSITLAAGGDTSLGLPRNW